MKIFLKIHRLIGWTRSRGKLWKIWNLFEALWKNFRISTAISKFVKVNYYVDGQLLAATEDEKENTGKTYVKFGVYRAGSHCAVTHKYENVKFERVF